jgi:menaquinone-dependent protoporphyrinogen oxidase
MSILVAYATKNGGTEGLATMLGEALRDEGLDVDVEPVSVINRVDGYEAVVLGAAVYTGRWHPDARRFARRHADALRDRPVWLFSSGPLDHSAEEHAIPAVKTAATAIEQVKARGHVTFGGRLMSDAHGWIARKMVQNGHGGDFRDHDHVAAWAHEIAAELRDAAHSG